MENVNKEPKFEQATPLWSGYEDRVSKAPEIILRKVLSPEEVATREGVAINELEAVIGTKIRQFAERCGKTCTYPDFEYWPLLEEMYCLFLSARSGEYKESIPWVDRFNSFDSFEKHFCPEITPKGRVFMKHNIQTFLEYGAHTERFLHISLEGRGHFDSSLGFFEASGSWSVLPEESGWDDIYYFAEEATMREIVELIRSGYREPDYSHATGSSALKNIGKSGAILSSNEAKKEGVEISTGEFVSFNNDIPLAERRGLSSVYVDRGGPRYGYHSINWFDEYFVNFGISKEKQDSFMRTTDFRYGLMGEGDEKLSADFGGEGAVIGPKVPLESVNFVYCWKKYQEQTEEWKNTFCPHAKVISYEAASVLSQFGRSVNAMAIEQQMRPEDVWLKLCEKAISVK